MPSLRGGKPRAVLAAASLAFAALSATPARAGDPVPFRLASAIDAPDWLTLGGSYRIRYETLDGPYRAKQKGSDQILVERLLLAARVRMDAFFIGGELEDSRQQLADTGTHLGTDSVDALEPLQFYAGFTAHDAFAPGSTLEVTAGRITIDEGSRRLVARNSFRNTINAFTGVRAAWHGAGGAELDAFYVLPVNREPTALDELLDNSVRMDSESWHTRLWGLFVSEPKLIGRATGEAYVYGFHNEDGPGLKVADRDLYTPGVRVVAKPAAGLWDYEAEAAMQFGWSRTTTSASDTRNLNHVAGFLHASAGYTWDAPWKPRLSLEYDYASGDEHPRDGTDNRFDTLYGARRFDFGPTGLYGAVARSNIDTPGLRLNLAPAKDLTAMIGYRALWLASPRDQWTTAGLTDPTGKSGSYLGQQVEGMLRYDPLPGVLSLEAGGAYLDHGSFQEHVPGAPAAANTTYGYLSATVTF